MNNTQLKYPDRSSRFPVAGAYDEAGPDHTRRNRVIALVVTAILVAGIWDYRSQHNQIAAIEDRIERIDRLVSRSGHNADTVRSLRGLLTRAQDDSAIIASRWVSNRQQALWTDIDRVDKRLRPLEQQLGVSSR